MSAGRSSAADTVSRLLEERLGYSRQVNRKTHEGASHPDRNAQFEHINAKVAAAMAAGEPVISVDTKKKELIGNTTIDARRRSQGVVLPSAILALPRAAAGASVQCPANRDRFRFANAFDPIGQFSC